MRQSPVIYADRVRTPTLFVHGEVDQRVPYEEAEQMYFAIKKQGVPAQMIRSAGMAHGIRGHWNVVHRAINELDWWDQWLKNTDTGIMDEPMLRVWMQDYASPEPFHAERSGRWVAEQSWPSPRIQGRRWHLSGTAGLENAPPQPPTLSICSPQTTGRAGFDWCGVGNEGSARISIGA